MTTPTLRGPAFEPWERFMLLDRAVQEVPTEHAAAVLPLVTMTAMVVIRQLMGQRTRAEAYAYVERARAAIETARRATPTPPHAENRRSA